MSNMKYMTLSDRIQSARKQAGLTQKELADRVGISQTAVHKLECGRSQSSRKTVSIALTCGVDPVWLETGRGDMSYSPSVYSQDGQLKTAQVAAEDGGRYLALPTTARVPLLTWKEAGGGEFGSPLREPSTWIAVAPRIGKNTFAMRISGDTMAPEFTEGDIILVDPDIPVDHNRFVVVRPKPGDEATFKQLIVDGGVRYLKPLNIRYPLVEIGPEAEFRGVIVGKFKEY
ncbi:MAG: helix-turn-helix domain-containing protein [Magnetococcales bacterium]|nr:helix-turn-helix domain-containing protein [Magnetococcales bacterium]